MTGMRELAEEFVEHFDFDFGEEGMIPVLDEDAPYALKTMVDALCPGRDPDCMAKLYEALSTIAEAEENACMPGRDVELDEKVCSLDFCLQVLDRLRELRDC